VVIMRGDQVEPWLIEQYCMRPDHARRMLEIVHEVGLATAPVEGGYIRIDPVEWERAKFQVTEFIKKPGMS
jgi:predicted small secreted protein